METQFLEAIGTKCKWPADSAHTHPAPDTHGWCLKRRQLWTLSLPYRAWENSRKFRSECVVLCTPSWSGNRITTCQDHGPVQLQPVLCRWQKGALVGLLLPVLLLHWTLLPGLLMWEVKARSHGPKPTLQTPLSHAQRPGLHSLGFCSVSCSQLLRPEGGTLRNRSQLKTIGRSSGPGGARKC